MMIDRKLPYIVARSLASIALVLALATACGDSKSSSSQGEPAASVKTQQRSDCEAVGQHLATLTQSKFQGLEGRKKKIMKTQLQLVREEFTSTCKKEKWTAEIRSCMTGAADLSAFNACTASLRAARGLPPPAATTGARKGPNTPAKPPATSPGSTAGATQ